MYLNNLGISLNDLKLVSKYQKKNFLPCRGVPTSLDNNSSKEFDAHVKIELFGNVLKEIKLKS